MNKKTRTLLMYRRILSGLIVLALIPLGVFLSRYIHSIQTYKEIRSLYVSSDTEEIQDEASPNTNYDNALQQSFNEGQRNTSESPIDFPGLLEANPDTIGWISCCEGKIDYPIVLGTDNDFYLHHDFYKKKSAGGCIFAQDDTLEPFIQPVTVIYGHNMNDKSMFHTLLSYKKEDYFMENRTFYIYSPLEALEYEIFSVIIEDYENIPCLVGNLVSSPDKDEISILKEMSLYNTGVEAKENDQIVMLVTCEDSGIDNRLVVCGVKK